MGVFCLSRSNFVSLGLALFYVRAKRSYVLYFPFRLVLHFIRPIICITCFKTLLQLLCWWWWCCYCCYCCCWRFHLFSLLFSSGLLDFACNIFLYKSKPHVIRKWSFLQITAVSCRHQMKHPNKIMRRSPERTHSHTHTNKHTCLLLAPRKKIHIYKWSGCWFATVGNRFNENIFRRLTIRVLTNNVFRYFMWHTPCCHRSRSAYSARNVLG